MAIDIDYVNLTTTRIVEALEIVWQVLIRCGGADRAAAENGFGGERHDLQAHQGASLKMSLIAGRISSELLKLAINNDSQASSPVLTFNDSCMQPYCPSINLIFWNWFETRQVDEQSQSTILAEILRDLQFHWHSISNFQKIQAG